MVVQNTSANNFLWLSPWTHTYIHSERKTPPVCVSLSVLLAHTMPYYILASLEAYSCCTRAAREAHTISLLLYRSVHTHTHARALLFSVVRWLSTQVNVQASAHRARAQRHLNGIANKMFYANYARTAWVRVCVCVCALRGAGDNLCRNCVIRIKCEDTRHRQMHKHKHTV